MNQLIIFTDLDGTLLDEQYCFNAAIPALNKIKQLNLPLIINSSKTYAEIAEIVHILGFNHPVITENGSFIAIPAHYFNNPKPLMLTLGASYPAITTQLQQCHQQGFQFTGFHQWTKKELTEITGLSQAMAAKALERQGTVPILWQDTEEQRVQFNQVLEASQLKLVKGGRFWHVMGQTDKGMAAKALMQYYYPSVNHYHCPNNAMNTVGLGDHANDLPMLEATAIAVVLPQATGDYAIDPNHPALIQAPESGPKGWNRVMSTLLNQFEQQGVLTDVRLSSKW